MKTCNFDINLIIRSGFMQMIYLYDNFFIDHFIQNQIKVKISCGTLAKKQVSLYVDFRIPREIFDNNNKLSCLDESVNWWS